MPTSRSFEFDYTYDVESVAELLRDPDFLRMRSEAAGDRNVEIAVTETADGIHLTVTRERTVEVPALVKGLVPSTGRAVENTTWHKSGEHWIADYSVEVSGLPGKVSGRTTLYPTAEGCHYESNFQVTTKVPLIGRKVEALVADGFAEQLSINAGHNANALIGRPPSSRPPKP